MKRALSGFAGIAAALGGAMAMWVASALGLAGAAHAEYSFCNKTSYAINAAIGYPDENKTVTRGWWRLRPGQCQVILADAVQPGRYFVYAEAIEGHRGEQRVWSGETPLCAAPTRFFTEKDHEACADEETRRLFSAVEVMGVEDGDWRTDFSEAANYSLFRAEIAGVQRLLNDLGYDIGELDGYAGRRTRIAVSAFKNEKGVGGAGLISDELIDALMESANARERDLGFFFCNDTDSLLWGAIGAPKGERFASRGWWRLEPKACAKVLKGALASDRYFVYATLEQEEGDLVLANGAREMCVNAVLFDIEDTVSCEDFGYDIAPFQEIETGDAKSWTHHFKASEFIARPPSEASPSAASTN
ncbi:MAG: DUF1036 domain-containing protein [Pseudomonadota bacterium]